MSRPTYECIRCGRRFLRADHQSLHQGHDHGPDLTESERKAFEDARRREDEVFEVLRNRVRGALVASPIVLTYVAFVALAAWQNVLWWAVLPAPGIIAFTMIAYHLAYTKDQAPHRPKR